MILRRTINAPPDVVFRVFTDPDLLPAWQPGLRGVVDRTGPLDQPGTTYGLDQPGPPLRIRVLRVERPTLHEQLEGLPWYGWIGIAHFEALAGNRTRLRYEMHAQGRPRWLWSAVVTVSSLVYARTELNRLKAVAERAALSQEDMTRS